MWRDCLKHLLYIFICLTLSLSSSQTLFYSCVRIDILIVIKVLMFCLLPHLIYDFKFNRINLSPNLVTNCKECQLVQFFWKIYSISISFLSEILQIHIWSFNTCVSLLFNALLFKQVSWSSKLKIKFFLLCLNRGGEILTNYFSHLNKQGFELCSFAKT